MLEEAAAGVGQRVVGLLAMRGGFRHVDDEPEIGTRALRQGDLDDGICVGQRGRLVGRSEEHTSELQSLLHISYAVFCLNKKNYTLYTFPIYFTNLHISHILLYFTITL